MSEDYSYMQNWLKGISILDLTKNEPVSTVSI